MKPLSQLTSEELLTEFISALEYDIGSLPTNKPLYDYNDLKTELIYRLENKFD